VPPACRQIDAKVRNCCGANKTLGHSLATAQYKREAVHVAVAASLPPSVRWVVSTEADVRGTASESRLIATTPRRRPRASFDGSVFAGLVGLDAPPRVPRNTQ